MSVSPVPLADVIRRVAPKVARFVGAPNLLHFALGRVQSDEALEQYVHAGQLEAYQVKSEAELANDVCEELADAAAYVCALGERDPLYLEAIEHLAMAHQIIVWTATR